MDDINAYKQSDEKSILNLFYSSNGMKNMECTVQQVLVVSQVYHNSFIRDHLSGGLFRPA